MKPTHLSRLQRKSNLLDFGCKVPLVHESQIPAFLRRDIFGVKLGEFREVIGEGIDADTRVASLSADQGQMVEILKVLAARLDGADAQTLRDTLDQLKNKLGSAAVVLGTVSGDKVSIVAGVTRDQTDRLKAGELVNAVASQVGGKGGGRPDMAQAGGNQPENLDAALKSVAQWVSGRLSV